MLATSPTKPHSVAELRANAINHPSARAYQVDGSAHFMQYVDPKQSRWLVKFGLTVNR